VMLQLVQLGMNALAAGCIYAVIALSFELAYESTGVVNFATGQLVTVGALIGASAVTLPAIGLGGAYVVTLAAMALVALLFLVAVYLPLRRQPVLTVVIGTVGAGIFMQNIALLVWGSLPRSMPYPCLTRT
jgi:branched-chain amino acid transport system permease protein